MDISFYLKSIGKTKLELSKELDISRPTLDLYIKIYESGSKIENERYQIIFDRLFSGENRDRAHFEKMLTSVKWLLERDRKYDIGKLDPRAADLIASIHNNMIHDMEDNRWNKKVYDAIQIFLSSYRTNDILRELAEYFSDLNSGSDLSGLTKKEKAYRSYYYKCFYQIINREPELDEYMYHKFLERKKEITKKREKKRSEVNSNISKRVETILEEVERDFQKRGIEASERELIAEVAKRMQ